MPVMSKLATFIYTCSQCGHYITSPIDYEELSCPKCSDVLLTYSSKGLNTIHDRGEEVKSFKPVCTRCEKECMAEASLTSSFASQAVAVSNCCKALIRWET